MKKLKLGLQPKQFTLEDVKKAIEMARQLSEHGIVDEEYDIENLLGYTEADTTRIKVKYSTEEIIQSLSIQQLPKEFTLGKGDTLEEQIKNGHYEY